MTRKSLRISQLLALLYAVFAVGAVVASSEEDTGYTIQASNEPPMISIGGTLVPFKRVTLSAQLPGRVKELAGSEGDAFTSGTLLVAIDDAELLAQRNAAAAEAANAQTRYYNARVQYDRELISPRSRSIQGGFGMPTMFDQIFTKPMADMTGISDPYMERRADLYSQGAAIREAYNQVESAHARVRAIDAKLRDARSVAPFNGKIIEKFVEVGDTVQPGQPLLTFADVEYLQLLGDIPSRLVSGLREGQMLQARLDIGGLEVPVRVAQIFPMADPTRHTVTVKFDVPKGYGAPGMYSTVNIPDFGSSAVAPPVVPASAVVRVGSLPRVYIKTRDGQWTPKLVRLGEQKGDNFAVLAGLTPGDVVLLRPPVNEAGIWMSDDSP